LAISSENYVPVILNYLLHLVTAAALVLAFFVVYTRITPYDEVALVRAGNGAAALSLGGSLIGFSATIASTVANTASYMEFAGGRSAR
jgi:putative membrane protein